MTIPRYARLAARVLARESVEAAPPLADERSRAIEAVAAALRAKKARRQRRSLLVVAAAVAAGAALVGAGLRGHRAAPAVATAPPTVEKPAAPASMVVVAHPSGDGATVVGAHSAPLVEGESLAPGSRIVARPGGHAILAFATGTRLTVEDEGDVTLVDGGPTSVIAVAHGALRADVAKLGERERFLVRTDDAEVEVRGTSFRVRAGVGGACAGATTRVEVYEGVVVVRHAGDEARVGPGESWPAGCAAQATAASLAPVKRAVPQAHTHADGPAPATPPASVLGAQNDLFGAAVAAKQAGDASGAIERFDEFVARWPASPLAESAAAQRMKLLHATDSTRAVAAARSYLAHWPQGFARAEAEGIVSGAR